MARHLAALVVAGAAAAAQAAVTLSESTSMVITPGNTRACSAATFTLENSYYRMFHLADFGVAPPFSVKSVNVGIESAVGGADATQSITVRLFDGGPLSAPGPLAAARTVSVPDQAGTIVAVPIEATISSGDLIVEIFSPDGTASGESFFIGTNSAGQSAPSYIRAPGCGAPAPTDLAALGFPDRHIVLTVTGGGRNVSTDFNGDGTSDVLWRNSTTGENYLYPMNGTTILGSEGYLRSVPDANWQIAGTGDFNGDGKADVLWRNVATGQNYIYLMSGTTIVGEGYLRTVALNWAVAGVGDFNGDGKSDIVWRNSSTGENYVYLMDGTAIAGEGYLRTVADLAWHIVGVADFDGDGNSDLLWRNSSSGQNYLYPMNGTSIKPTEGFVRAVTDLAWQVKGVGDFDGDGKADILWRNSASGENYLYPMDGTTIKPGEGYVRTVADLNWRIAAVGDYDGDGKSDVLWRNSSTGQNYLYPMNGTAIKPSEGYLRTVADPNWQVQR